VAGPLSYLLCGTPRTGSTLLCGLLTSTGVAGRAEVLLPQPDEHAWVRRLGVPVAGDGSFDYRWFVRAVRGAGSTPNGVFAARVMWGTMQRIVDGLDVHDLSHQALPSSTRRPASTTAAPSAATRSATARPIPDVAPTTITTFELSREPKPPTASGTVTPLSQQPLASDET
jgi:hypothetical protein